MLKKFLAYESSVYAFISLAIVGLMSTSYFFQYVMDLKPCNLCMVQRTLFISIGVIAIVGLLQRPRRAFNTVYSLLLVLLTSAGVAIASRQVWLQSLPKDQVPSCTADFAYIVENFPLLKAVSMLWKGSGDCAEVQWQFLGLSIAGWALVWFSFFCLLAIYQLFRKLPS